MALEVLFSAHHLMMLYICMKFHKNILDGIEVIERRRFSLKKNKLKGHRSTKVVDEVTILSFAQCLIAVYTCNK